MMVKDTVLVKNIQPDSEGIVESDGETFTTKGGKKYLDFSSQTVNLHLGQRHQVVSSGVKEYIKKHPTFLSTRFKIDEMIELAHKLVENAPKGLGKVNLKLTNGSDANESAFKRVRMYSGKPYIMSFTHSHLGETCETLAASGTEEDRKKFIGGSDKFIFLDFPFDEKEPGNNKQLQQKSIEQIRSIVSNRDDIAALILEPIMVNAGAFEFPQDYLKEVASICKEAHIALVFDEIQTAFGWLGHIYFASKHDLEPDIITLGKSLSAGLPLAGIVMKDKYDVLDYGLDELTYGGHILSILVALENIKYLENSHIMDDVKKKNMIVMDQLHGIKNDFPDTATDIRGSGLIFGISFPSKKFALDIHEECLNKGLVCRKTQNGNGSSLVLKPSLITSNDELRRGCQILRGVVESLS